MLSTSHVNNFATQGVVPYNTLVGKAIDEIRTRTGVTQSDMASALEIGQSAYSKLESGQAAMTLAQLRAVAVRLDCEPNDILRRSDGLARELERNGVQVPTKKDDNKAAILIGLGLLLALMSKG